MTSAHEPVSLQQWRAFLTDNAEGALVDGRVVSVVPFGAFIELDHGVHGLLHVSEWDSAAGAPAEGATLRLRIQQVDLQRRRVSLSGPVDTARRPA